MYLAYRKVAHHFAGRDEFRTAIYFSEKCLEIAQLLNNPAYEGECDHFLGLMFDKSATPIPVSAPDSFP
jgi:hypothetical protein